MKPEEVKASKALSLSAKGMSKVYFKEIKSSGGKNLRSCYILWEFLSWRKG